MEQVLNELLAQGPVVALLAASIYYFLKREARLEALNKELYDELRDSEKATIITLNELSTTMNLLLEEINERNAKIVELNK